MVKHLDWERGDGAEHGDDAQVLTVCKLCVTAA